LCQYQDELKRLNAKVLIVSFGSVALARRWIAETCSPFIMLLDRERAVYRAYGLRSSWVRSWNFRTLWFYVRMVLSGRRLRGVQGDPNQLGGDFIVDTQGILRLSYPSREATDRPRVADLLNVLRQLRSQSP